MGLALPAELLYEIWTHLDFHSKVNCQLVCKAWDCLLRQPQRPIWSTVSVEHHRLCKAQDKGDAPVLELMSNYRPLKRRVATTVSICAPKGCEYSVASQSCPCHTTALEIFGRD